MDARVLNVLESSLTSSMTQKIPSAEAYTSEPVRYPPLVIMDLATEAAAVTEEYRNQVLCQVNASCLRLGVMTGNYPWHQHSNSDELFLVMDGRLEIELADGHILKLGPWQSVVIPAGTIHRTRGVGRTINLCFEAMAAKTVFVERAT
jgi:mannose-6-phosphate isomerase-like protein (cupin superfamily)